MSDNELQHDNILEIIDNIIDETTFDRMRKLGKTDFKNYDDFHRFCVNCITDLTRSERIWLNVFCNQINDGIINIVDEESFVEFTACSFYFNINRELCIVSPR
jgi:hypothetical protein